MRQKAIENDRNELAEDALCTSLPPLSSRLLARQARGDKDHRGASHQLPPQLLRGLVRRAEQLFRHLGQHLEGGGRQQGADGLLKINENIAKTKQKTSPKAQKI